MTTKVGEMIDYGEALRAVIAREAERRGMPRESAFAIAFAICVDENLMTGATMDFMREALEFSYTTHLVMAATRRAEAAQLRVES